eukprot:TRINITY_DN66336_c0_g1_i1.p2 TRINITY_DN66336_c0_g1~~TRINITY_DN66336_c0_g1_i1.p2  ORF type:complete len:167 (-),score=24.78 TRINITY_DN66336_c0_g1_i1:182-682(-)
MLIRRAHFMKELKRINSNEEVNQHITNARTQFNTPTGSSNPNFIPATKKEIQQRKKSLFALQDPPKPTAKNASSSQTIDTSHSQKPKVQNKKVLKKPNFYSLYFGSIKQNGSLHKYIQSYDLKNSTNPSSALKHSESSLLDIRTLSPTKRIAKKQRAPLLLSLIHI